MDFQISRSRLVLRLVVILTLGLGVAGVSSRSTWAQEKPGQVPAELLTSLSGVPVPGFDESDLDFIRKCQDYRALIQQALRAAYHVSSAEQEIRILVSAIDRALALGNSHLRKFFELTLKASEVDMDLYPQDPERKAFLLKTYMEWSLEDLAWFDRARNHNDNGPYVRALLSRAAQVGYMARKDAEEIVLLVRSFARAIALIAMSDYRRSQAYACEAKVLIGALQLVQYGGLDEESQVVVLRQALSDAQSAYCR